MESHHAFVNTSAGKCQNCCNQGAIETKGFVHLDNALNAHAGLPSLDPDAVVLYLKENLSWPVQKVMNRATVPALLLPC